MGSQSATNSERAAVGGRLASALVVHRHEASLHLLNSISDWPRWRTDIAASTAMDGSIDFFQPVLFVFVDYLSQFFATGDSAWKYLYVGEKLKLLREAGGDGKSTDARRDKLAHDDQRGLLTIFRRKLKPDDFAEFERLLASVTSLLITPARVSVRALLIGDFLQLDVLPLLDAQLLEAQIALEPTCIGNPDVEALRAALLKLSKQNAQGYDFIFFSPLSDLDCPTIAELDGWRNALTTARTVDGLAETAARSAIATVELLRSLWTCPIILNNAAVVSRHDSGVYPWLRNHLTGRLRREFGAHVNRLLGEYARSARAADAVQIFDEHAFLAKHDQWLLGQPLPGLQRSYPILLGKLVASAYKDLIAAGVHTLASQPAPPPGPVARLSVG